MEEVDKGCPMTKMGVSGWMFLVPAYPGSLGPKAVKRLCICLRLFTKQAENQKQTQTDRKIVQIT